MAAGVHFDLYFKAQTTLIQGAVVLYQVSGFIELGSDADTYLMLFDQPGIPALGNTPVRSYHLTPGANFSIALDGPPGEKGRRFVEQCWLAISSTPFQYTEPAAPNSNEAIFAATGRNLA